MTYLSSIQKPEHVLGILYIAIWKLLSTWLTSTWLVSTWLTNSKTMDCANINLAYINLACINLAHKLKKNHGSCNLFLLQGNWNCQIIMFQHIHRKCFRRCRTFFRAYFQTYKQFPSGRLKTHMKKPKNQSNQNQVTPY